MISQLFALPLRALVIAAALPTPPALGAALAGPSDPPPGMIGALHNPAGLTPQARIAAHSGSRSVENPAGG
jgi:hypothetical protein